MTHACTCWSSTVGETLAFSKMDQYFKGDPPWKEKQTCRLLNHMFCWLHRKALPASKKKKFKLGLFSKIQIKTWNKSYMLQLIYNEKTHNRVSPETNQSWMTKLLITEKVKILWWDMNKQHDEHTIKTFSPTERFFYPPPAECKSLLSKQHPNLKLHPVGF